MHGRVQQCKVAPQLLAVEGPGKQSASARGAAGLVRSIVWPSREVEPNFGIFIQEVDHIPAFGQVGFYEIFPIVIAEQPLEIGSRGRDRIARGKAWLGAGYPDAAARSRGGATDMGEFLADQIGRASCRERVCQYV